MLALSEARHRVPGSRVFALLALLVGFATASQVHAQANAEITMSTDRLEMAVGEPFVLTIRAEVRGGDAQAVEAPNLDAFDVIRRSVSRPMSFSFSFGNGQQRQQTVQSTTVYRYTLRARSPGRVQLAPATVQVGGRTFRSQSLTLQISASGSPQAAPSTQGTGGVLSGALIDPQAFVRTEVSNPTPYVGEQVTVSIYLYTRARLHEAPQTRREPTTAGFWTQDLLPSQRNLTASRQTVQGAPYDVYLLKQFAAFPLAAGTAEIGAPRFEFPILASGGFFGSVQQLTRDGVPVSIEVRPLPDPAPNGAVVGSNFSLELDLDRQQVRTGDAITATAQIRGRGQLENVRLALAEQPGLRILQPEHQSRSEIAGGVLQGEATYEWIIVPEQAGTYTLPALSLSVFDPRSERYVTVQSESRQFVAAGNNTATAPPAPDPETPSPPAEVSAPPAQLPPAHPQSELRRQGTPVSAHPGFLALLFGIPLLFVVAAMVAQLRDKGRTQRQHTKASRQRLGDAKAAAKAGDAKAFYRHIATALTGALQPRLPRPVSGFTHTELRDALQAQGLDPDLCKRIVDELESCDFARFSSAGATPEEMQRCLERSQALLTRFSRLPQEPS